MGNPLYTTGLFLIEFAFNSFILILLLYFLLRLQNVSFSNPVMPFLAKVSNPLVKPLRKIIPKHPKQDAIALGIALLLIQMLAVFIVTWIKVKLIVNPIGLLIWAIAELLKLLLQIYFYAILARAIMSFVNPTLRNSFTWLLYAITEPLLAPVKRFVPPLAGFDLSPVVVLLLLQISNFIIVNPLFNLAISLSK